MSEVFLVPGRASDDPELTARQIDALWRAAGLDDVFRPRDLTAVKLHVGEPGTRTFVRPPLVAALVRRIAAIGAEPFLTDTAVLYKSPRDNGVGHARVAHEHGFTLEAVGAPFLPADGVNGAEEIEVRVDGKHFDKVTLAPALLHAGSVLLLSHATGHLGVGFGGALKNLGMGCSSRKGKLRQHHGHAPRIDAGLCTACGLCAEWCPSGAITVEQRSAAIAEQTCIGCGECIAVCRDGAVEFDWAIMGHELQERIVEHAAALVRRKPGRIAYVTVAQGITKDCDCLGEAQPPLVEDIGILASRDPVAIDQAVLELVRQRAGRSLESLSYPRRDGSVQVRYAEAMGLGRSRVELVPVQV